jgi:hypothetical protein
MRTNTQAGEWPSRNLLATIDRVFDAALPVLLARSAAVERQQIIQIGSRLSRALVELTSEGVSDYRELLDRALQRAISEPSGSSA